VTEAPRPPEALARFSLYGRVLISAENIEGWYQILSGGDVSAASSLHACLGTVPPAPGQIT